jgi:hypothetical protein
VLITTDTLELGRMNRPPNSGAANRASDTEKPSPAPMSPLRRVAFWASLPLALVLMTGELLAWPFAKHRQSSFLAWLLYRILRFALPGVILGFCAVWLLKRILL